MNPATLKMIAKAVISQLTNEESRQRLLIGIIIVVVIFMFIIMIPIYILTSPLEAIKQFFSSDENGNITDGNYQTIVDMKNNYGTKLETGELIFNGTFPMPVENATITCEFGPRIHPVTGKQSYHTGIDLAGKWHSNIMSVLDGKVMFAGVQSGYGNCVEIEHKSLNGTIFYTFYGHLARIDVVNGREIKQGNVIGLQGGDPNRDPNPGYSTGSHLHFEVRKTFKGDFLNPRKYLFENEEV